MSPAGSPAANERRSLAGSALVAFLFLVGPGALVLTSCAGPQSVDAGSSAAIAFEGAPQGTIVYVDEIPRAVLGPGRPPVTVPAGIHRIRIEADGFLVERIDVELRPGELYDLVVHLWPCVPVVDVGCFVGASEAGAALLE